MLTFRSAPIVLDVHSGELLLRGAYFGWHAISLEPCPPRGAAPGRDGIALTMQIEVTHRMARPGNTPALFTLLSRHCCAARPDLYVVAGTVTPMFDAPLRTTARIDTRGLSSGSVQLSLSTGRDFWDLRWWMELLGDVVPEDEDVDLGGMLARLHLPIA